MTMNDLENDLFKDGYYYKCYLNKPKFLIMKNNKAPGHGDPLDRKGKEVYSISIAKSNIEFAMNMKYYGYGAAQVASYIIEKNKDNKNKPKNEEKNEIDYVRLLNLMYLVDREIIYNLLEPITGDTYVYNEEFGIILDNTFNCIKNPHYENVLWYEYMKSDDKKDTVVQIEEKKLSKDDYCFSNKVEEIINGVLEKFITKSGKELIDETKKGIEISNKSNNERITIETILKHFDGKNDTEKDDYLKSMIRE